MITVDYNKIFALIDLSNGPQRNSNGAEARLMQLGIYNSEGELITDDKKIVEYYEANWC